MRGGGGCGPSQARGPRPAPASPRLPPQEGATSPLSVKWADPDLQMKKRRAVEESNTDNRMVRAAPGAGPGAAGGASRRQIKDCSGGCSGPRRRAPSCTIAPTTHPRPHPPDPDPRRSSSSPRCCAAPARTRCARCLGASAASSRSTCSGPSRWVLLQHSGAGRARGGRRYGAAGASPGQWKGARTALGAPCPCPPRAPRAYLPRSPLLPCRPRRARPPPRAAAS
jgi:hypothetical protein